MKTLLAVTLLLSATSLSTAARADDQAACVDAAAKGRMLREKHAFAAAYAQFQVCSAQACPVAVQAECAAGLAAVEKGLSTVLLTPPSPSPLLLAPLLPEAPRYRSNGMRITGMVLTALGGAMLAGGVAATAWGSSQHCTNSCDNDFSGVGGALVGFSLIGLSTVFAGVGIPLWAVGGAAPDRDNARLAPSWAVPTIAAGARSVTLRWSF